MRRKAKLDRLERQARERAQIERSLIAFAEGEGLPDPIQAYRVDIEPPQES